MKKIMLFLILTLLPNLINAATVEEQTEALLETANAYLRQGVQIQYDSYKKDLYSTPEDATSQHYNYTVCSGFTFSTYYHTFGIEIPYYTEALLEYAQTNKANTAVVPYYLGTSEEIFKDDVLGDTTSNVNNFVKNWIDNGIVKPGDVFVVTGHAMLITEIGTSDINIIESGFESGKGRYDMTNHVDKFETKGSIKTNTATKALTVYFNKKNISELAILRFMNEEEKFLDEEGSEILYNIIPSAKSRVKYKSIDIEKVATVINGDISLKTNEYADLGDTIKYTLKITNNSEEKYENIIVTENIDSEIVSIQSNGNGTESANSITWTINEIAPSETKTIEYSVLVKKDNKNKGARLNSTGTVDNIPTSKIETYINTKFTPEEEKKILEAYNTLINGEKIERDFINEIYTQALGINLGISNLSNNDILKYNANIKVGGTDNTLSVKTTEIINEDIKKYLLNNYYGLRIGDTNVADDNIVRGILQWNVFPENELLDRARSLDETMLRFGDIILTYTGETATTDTNLVDKAYIYINGELVRKTSATATEKLSGDELNTFLLNTIGENYIILRPSISLERTFLTIDDNNEENNSNGGTLNQEDIPDTGVSIPIIFISVLLIGYITITKLNKSKITKI